jgi:2-polyprenyl-6-methoxyphenol hydroxylase-like FAD-dependent oxidoreductase
VESLPIIIAGAGIGGLTLAAALKHHGIACRVFEKAAALRPIGAGITMQSNAMLALRAIGLEDAVRAAGAVAGRADLRRDDGGLLATVDFAAIAQAIGAPTVAIHRGDLHAVLLAAAGDVTLLGAEAAGYRDDGDTITLLLVGGREARGRALIGADGVHSALRTQLLGESPLRYAGYTTWRGVTGPDVAATLPPELIGGEALGRGERFGWIALARGRVYWYAVAATPAGETDADPRETVRARFASWGVPAAALLEATAADEIVRTDVFDRPPVTTWGAGRITLLGDAIHPMTPNLGQGGGQAVEDAVVLASCLAADEPVAALRRYEAMRIKRANRFVVESHRAGVLFQARNALAATLRNAMLRTTSGLTTGRTLRLMRAGFALGPGSPPAAAAPT